VQASVGGKVAQLGQRLIDGAAKSLAEDFSNVLMQRCKPNILKLMRLLPNHQQRLPLRRLQAQGL